MFENIKSIFYDPFKLTLRLTYEDTGNAYQFEGIPNNIWQEFESCDYLRRGTFFNRSILHVFPYQKMENNQSP